MTTWSDDELGWSLIAIAGLLLCSTVGPRDEPAPPRAVEVRTAGDLVVEHTVLSSVADDLPALEQLDSVRYAELAITEGPAPCR